MPGPTARGPEAVDAAEGVTATTWTRRLLDRLAPVFPLARQVADPVAARLLVAGVAVGAIGGLAAGVFDRAMVLVGRLTLGTAEPALNEPVWWRALLAPTLLGAVAGLLLVRLTRRGRAQSVPDVLGRTQLHVDTLSLRDGVVSAVAAALVVGGGVSGGREGPIVQVSSALASWICRRLRLPPRHARALLAAGAAAGVAASFNTPVGGAFFGLEIVLGDFALESFAPVVVATVTGTIVGQALLGDRVALHLPPFRLVHPAELVLYLVLGLVSGLVAVSFKRLLIEGTHRADGVVLPLPARGALAGLFVGAVAAAGAYPVMGNGYAWMELVIGHPEQVGLGMLVVLLVAKPIATAVTAAGRTGAGLFAPSLYLGAVTGVAFGRLAGDLFPQVVSSPGAFGMVGMGAVAAAVLHAPITLTLMLFEMTGLYDVILPLLLTLATSGLISAMVGSESIYALELKARGLPLPSSRPRDALAGVRVTDLARASDLEVVRADTPLTDLLARFLAVRAQTVWVVGPDGRLDGAIELHDLKELLAKPREGLVAGDLVSRDVPRLHGEEPLADSVPLFFRSFREELPVVDGEGRLVGVLAQRDVVAAFHRALAEDEDVLIAPVRSGSSGLRSTDYVELPEGQALDVVALPDRLAGRTLRALGLPRTHGITVLATSRWDPRRSRWERLPVDPDAPIGRGDRLVIVGPAERIARWEALAEGIDDEQA